jgi:hypothetical protein
MAELTLKERLNNRLVGLKAARKGFEPEAKEIAAYAQPAKSRWLSTATNKGPGRSRQYNKNMNSSHGVFAFRTLQGGMTSGLTSESRPWMALGSFDERFNDHAEVRAYFSEVEKRFYKFIAATNFYGAVKTGYLEMGLFGTEACIAMEHAREGMVCHQLTFGEYWLGLGSSMQAEALYRECPMTVKQSVDSFGKTNLDPTIVRLYDKSNYDSIVTFYHAIETNDDQIPGLKDFRGKPWRSVYWCDGDGDNTRMIQRQGFEEQPFWAPRWDTTGNDVWGQGPGHDALPDLRELQLQAKRKAEATDMAVWPEKVVSGKVKLKNQPKSVVSVAAADVDLTKMVMIPHKVDYNTILAIKDDMEVTKQAINEATFADLFMAITNMNGVQPRNVEEIAARNEEKLTQLGPVIERVNNEKLEVAVERIIAIMQRAGMLPPAPAVLREAPDIKIEFISILTQMQRMVGLGQIERAFGFIGSAAGMFPEVRHKIDAMEMIDEYWERAGAPAKILRPTEDAQADADQEAQNAQAAQAAEMAGKAAPAGKVAVDAAALAAQTPQAAPPAVADLVPLIPR